MTRGAAIGAALPPGWRALVCDLDGTLVDSAPELCAAGNAALASEGLPPVPFPVARGCIGRGASRFIAGLERASSGENRPGRTDRLIRHFRSRNHAAPPDTCAFPGAGAALAALHDAGLRLALCTNKPEGPARAMLARMGWAPLFDVVVGGDTLPAVKPDPAPLLAAIARLGLAPRQALFIGDSEVDAETATRAGVDFALFLPGYRSTPPDRLPHRLTIAHWSGAPGLIPVSL